MKKKVIGFTESFEKEIIEFQKSEGLPTFAETVRFTIKLGMMKKRPSYVSTKKSNVEKIVEKKQAEEMVAMIEKEKFELDVKSLGGYICDREGREDQRGEYYTYTQYSLARYSNPPRVLVNKIKNHKSEIEHDKESQFENTSASDLVGIIESGNFVVDSMSDEKINIEKLKELV